MAMMEYKTRDVNNEDEASTIEFWSRFGWTLKSSQRVYNKDTHLESSGNGLRLRNRDHRLHKACF